MPIDLKKALKATFQPVEYRCDEDKVIFYALSVGACAEGPQSPEFPFVYEGSSTGLKVLPTFGVIPPFASLGAVFGAPGIDVNPLMILHGEQYLEIRKHPIPPRGTFRSTPRIQNIYDKGKGALILLDTVTVDGNGEEIFFNTFSLFARGEGGFGGERGPNPGFDPPSRPPDFVVQEKTFPNQALLYRLNADRNPLHADPQIAQMVGYPIPILHGLCTFGFVGRAVLRAVLNYETERFLWIKVRFSGHVFPGETLITEMWKEKQDGKDIVILKTKTLERGHDVITNAAVGIRS